MNKQLLLDNLQHLEAKDGIMFNVWKVYNNAVLTNFDDGKAVPVPFGDTVDRCFEGFSIISNMTMTYAKSWNNEG